MCGTPGFLESLMGLAPPTCRTTFDARYNARPRAHSRPIVRAEESTLARPSLAGDWISYLQMFLAQTVLHSVISLFLIEVSLKVWGIQSARERFRYRLQVLLLPPLMFPAFQLFEPTRGSFYFMEEEALFSSARWLSIEVLGGFPVGPMFVLILVATSLLTLVQEVIPVLRDWRRSRHSKVSFVSAGSEIEGIVSDLSERLSMPQPRVRVVSDDNPVLFVSETDEPTVVISDSLLETLDRPELISAMAHELAHIRRRSTLTTTLAFLVRVAMFYNPISLLVFRRLIQDDENVCDEMTVSVTGNPSALASALQTFYVELPEVGRRGLSAIKSRIESSSHNLMISERIARLEGGAGIEPSRIGWGAFAITLVSILAIGYRVV